MVMRYQPQGLICIDPTASLVRGLVSLAPLSSRSARDAVDGTAWAITQTGPAIDFTSAPRGKGLHTGSGKSAYLSRVQPASITNSVNQPITFRYRLFITALPISGVLGGILSWGASSGSSQPRYYVRFRGTGVTAGVNVGMIEFYYASGGGVYRNPVAITPGEHIITHTFDGTTHSVYVDGAYVGGFAGAWTLTGGSFFAGNGYDSPAGDFMLSDFAIWNRALSANEVKSDAANPWQIFDSASTRSTILAAFASATTSAPINGAQKAITMAIGEIYSQYANTARARPASTAIIELNGITANTARLRGAVSNINENEVLNMSSSRARSVTYSMAENQVSGMSAARMRSLNTLITESTSMSASIAHLKMIQASLVELASMSADTKRTRGLVFTVSEFEALQTAISRLKAVQVTLNESSSVAQAIKRIRAAQASINEVESLVVALGKVKALSTHITETESIAADFVKAKTIGMSIHELESLALSTLIKVKTLAFLISSGESVAAANKRVRGMTFATTEVQNASASLARGKHVSAAIHENEIINGLIARVRGISTEVDVSLNASAKVDRIRHLATQIAESLGVHVTINASQSHPDNTDGLPKVINVFDVTAKFEKWTVDADGTLNLQAQEFTWSVSDTSEEVILELGSIFNTVITNGS